MKRKFVTLSLAVCAAVCLCFGLTACRKKGDDGTKHTHTHAAEWSYDETYHWHTATCEHTDEVNGKSEHVWNSGEVSTEPTCTTVGKKTFTCTVCGQTKTEEIAATGHSYSDEWSSDETYHWHTATCEHTDEVSGKAEHTYVNGVCTVCGKHENGLKFRINSDNASYSVTGIGTYEESNLVIPAEYNKLPVTSIGSYAFEGCSGLTSITIPDSVTSIGSYAFEGCSSFNYNEYDNAYYLGNETNPYVVLVKAKETSITSCSINTNTKVIYNSAFYGCSKLTSVTIGNGVTSIGRSAFSFCKSLTSITIPDSVTSIGNRAFEDCSGLTSMTIPDSVTSIGYYAFESGSSLNYNEYDNAYYLGNETNPYVVLVKAKETSITSCSINTNTKVIYNSAFYGCSGLTSIIIPDSVTSIGDHAFEDCSSFNYNEYNNAYYLGNETNPYIVLVKAKETSITSCLINTNTKVIYNSAFYGCSKLTSVTIGNGVTSIGRSAFSFCKSLTSITIPDSVTSIGSYAFKGCIFTSITIPDSVTSIGDHAFEGCSELTSVTIGNSVTSIGDRAFYGCSGLTSIIIPDSVTSIGNRAFEDCSGLTSMTIPDSVTSIGSYAFYGCSGLTSVTIGNSVTSIGSYAFYGCSGLTSVTIGNSVTSIGSYAFEDCSGLTSIIIPDSVTSIGDYAFFKCSKLTSITIPDSVTSIGYYAFESGSSLNYNEYDNAYYLGNETNPYVVLVKAKETSITSCSINTNTKVIYNSAFYGCSGLTSIIIPDSVTSIGNRAFYGCSGLTSMTIPDSVTSIGNRAFEDCSGLTSMTIPDSVTSIGYYAFESGSSLNYNEYDNAYYLGNETNPYVVLVKAKETSITSCSINTNTKVIYNSAFYGCSGLTSIIIPDSVTSIGDRAFYGCSSLTSIIIPDSVTSIGDHAFFKCSKLTSITFKGTKEQWNAITKGDNWDYGTGTYIIHCTDGDITKN